MLKLRVWALIILFRPVGNDFFIIVLLHIQHQPFQVFTFGVVDIDGMVLGLMELVEDTHSPPDLRCRGEDCQAEHLFVYRLRARESEEDTAVAYLLYCLRVDTLVAAQGVFDSVAVLGEGRRVEDNEVVGTVALRRLRRLAFLFEESKRLLGIGMVVGAVREVARHVGIHQRNGFLRHIHRVHCPRSAAQGV